VAEQVRYRSNHERDIGPQHEPLVDVWTTAIANCRNGENGELKKSGKVEQCCGGGV
jgi:hypothetical protein